MKWSVSLGRWMGIDVYLHVTFLLLLGFVAVANGLQRGSLGAAASGTLYFVCIFLCVLLHEFGHALMARRYGIRTRDITLLPIGGLARLERMPEQPIQELWVALAGPAVNVVIAAGLALGLSAAGLWLPSQDLSGAGLTDLRLLDSRSGFLELLLVTNLFLVGFNLLPAFPMDGGRVLRALLAMRMDYARATRVAATVGQGMALVFGFLGLFGNPMLLVIALFVWIGAAQESGMAQMKSALDGVAVRNAMITDFRALAPDHTLGQAAEWVLAGSQADFPVVEGGRLVGILSRQAIVAGLSRQGANGRVGEAMSREFAVAAPGDPLESTLVRQAGQEVDLLPVLDNGRLVGFLTRENVGEYLLLQSALRPPPLPPRPPTA